MANQIGAPGKGISVVSKSGFGGQRSGTLGDCSRLREYPNPAPTAIVVQVAGGTAGSVRRCRRRRGRYCSRDVLVPSRWGVGSDPTESDAGYPQRGRTREQHRVVAGESDERAGHGGATNWPTQPMTETSATASDSTNSWTYV